MELVVVDERYICVCIGYHYGESVSALPAILVRKLVQAQRCQTQAR